MKIKLKAFLVSFLATVLLAGLLASRVNRSISGVTVVRLVTGCQVEISEIPAQPVFTTTLACSREDPIRVWPLPIKQDWDEEQYKKSVPATGMPLT